MKNVITKGLFLIAITSLTACKSTPKYRTEYPDVTVYSEDVYQWRDDISFAMNIAKMVQPSGIGYGVEDEENPLEASNNRSGAGMKTLSALAGFGVGGFIGVLNSANTESEINKGRTWNPILVDFIPVSDLPDPKAKSAYLTIRNYVSGNIRTALTAEYPKLEWKGAYFMNAKSLSSESVALFYDNSCKAAYNLGNNDDPWTEMKWKGTPTLFEYTGDISQLAPYCSFQFTSEVTGKISIKGIDYWLVATTTDGSSSLEVFYTEVLKKQYTGYLLNPDSYHFFTFGDGGKRWNNPYPFVSHNGKRYLFDKNDTAKSLQL